MMRFSLTLIRDSTDLKLYTESFFVDRFKQAWPKRPVYLNGCANNLFREHIAHGDPHQFVENELV